MVGNKGSENFCKTCRGNSFIDVMFKKQLVSFNTVKAAAFKRVFDFFRVKLQLR